MVLSRSAVHGALFLVLDFFCLAVFYLLQDAPFLFAVQIIVYAGAIMVLFLFVLMLIGVDRSDSLVETLPGQRVGSVVAGVLVAVLLSTVVGLTWWGLGLVILALLPLGLPTFWVSIAVEIFAFALFAASLHLLMAVGGMVSFGHAAYFGLGAYGAALLLKTAGLPMPAAFVVAPLVAALAAVVFGYFCVRLSSIYFAMLTLAFAQIVYAIAHQWDEVTGGDNGVLSVWPARWLASPGRYYYWALVATVLGIVLLRRVAASPFGLTLRAARDHAQDGASPHPALRASVARGAWRIDTRRGSSGHRRIVERLALPQIRWSPLQLTPGTPDFHL